VVLSGMGMAEYFPLIGMVLAVDPIIDMARTLANVSGAMTAAVATDREVGLMDMNIFYDPNISLENEQSDV
jgi:Predicted Na+/dicarboxylate symporter